MFLCVAVDRAELGASAAVSWAAFLLALRDQPEPKVAPPRLQRAAGFSVCAASLLAAATLGVFDANDRNWRLDGAGAGILNAARLAPLVFGIGLFLWRSPLPELRARWRALFALTCPLFTPVPGWLRLAVDPSRVSAWGAQRLLGLCGLHVEREGSLLLRPEWRLAVATECSGLGALLQLLALVVLLAVVTRAAKARLAVLVPCAVGIALLVNFARLAWLGWLLEQGNLAGYDFWHMGRGSLIYSGTSAALLLAVGLPLTLWRSRAPVSAQLEARAA